MRDLALTVQQVKYENRSFWRNPPAAIFTFVFPLMFLVIFNLVFGTENVPGPGAEEISQSNFYVAGIAAFSIVTACYTNVAIGVSFSRDDGILKRMRGTPLPAASYLTARIIHAAFVGVLLVLIVTIAGALFYGVDAPTNTLPAVAVNVIVGSAAFAALGLAMTAAVPNAEASPAIVNAAILPLLFISDVFIPLEENAPGWLLTVANFFPVRHLSEAMQTAFSPFTEGSGFEWTDLLIVASWGMAGLLAAVKFFRWEPRR